MKKIIITALLLVGIATYIKFVEFPTIQQEEAERKILGSFSSSEIESISLKQGDIVMELQNKAPHKEEKKDPSEGVDLSQEGARKEALTSWGLKDAPLALLEKSKIEALTTALAELESVKFIPAKDLEADLGIYGLTNPEVTLTVKVNQNTTILSFGKKNDFVGARYVKIDGKEGLYLVNDALFDVANKNPADFRDKTPVSFSDDEVKSVLISSVQNKLRIEPTKDHGFRIVEPINVVAQNYSVFDLYRNLRNLQAELFIDSPTDLSVYGLSTPQNIIEIQSTKDPLKITVGSKNDKEFFQINSNGPVYQAVGHPLAGLEATPDLYRESQQFKFDHYSASKLLIEKNGSPTVVIVKTDDSYKVNDKDSDTPFVRQFLRDISEIQAKSFLSLDDPVLNEKPLMKVSITTENGQEKKVLTLIIGAKREGGYPAYTEQNREPFLLTEASYALLEPAADKFTPVKK